MLITLVPEIVLILARRLGSGLKTAASVSPCMSRAIVCVAEVFALLQFYVFLEITTPAATITTAPKAILRPGTSAKNR